MNEWENVHEHCLNKEGCNSSMMWKFYVTSNWKFCLSHCSTHRGTVRAVTLLIGNGYCKNDIWIENFLGILCFVYANDDDDKKNNSCKNNKYYRAETDCTRYMKKVKLRSRKDENFGYRTGPSTVCLCKVTSTTVVHQCDIHPMSTSLRVDVALCSSGILLVHFSSSRHSLVFIFLSSRDLMDFFCCYSKHYSVTGMVSTPVALEISFHTLSATK